jgi:hypothetical protein
MAYIFTLHLKKDSSTLTLSQDGVVRGERSWPEARDMGRRLFESLAELLKGHDLKPEMVEDFVVESELPEIYTSARIAETVKRVYTFGVRARS